MSDIERLRDLYTQQLEGMREAIMPEEDNVPEPEPVQLHTPQPQQGQVAINIQVTPQGTVLSCAYPMQLGIPTETMDQWSKEWVLSRPQLLLEIVQTAKKAQKQGLALIQHVNRSKIN